MAVAIKITPMSESKLVCVFAYANLCLTEAFIGLARQTPQIADRLRLDTLGAGHFAIFAEQTESLHSVKGRFEELVEPFAQFLSVTAPANRTQSMLRLAISAGLLADLSQTMIPRLEAETAQRIAPGKAIWRSIDFASSQVVEDISGSLSLYGRRVISEAILLVQMLAARDVELSNVLSGTDDDGLADLAGVGTLMDGLLESAMRRMRHLGLNA